MSNNFKIGDKVYLEKHYATWNETKDWTYDLPLNTPLTVRETYDNISNNTIRLAEDRNNFIQQSEKFKLWEENKYTIEYINDNRIIIKIENEKEYKELINRKANLCLFNGPAYYCAYTRSWSIYPTAWIDSQYKVIDFSQINFEGKMEKKIIGYKCIYDLFDGKVLAGTLFKQMNKPNDKYTTEANWKSYHGIDPYLLPKEIVEKWAPVYKEEKIEIMGYVAEKDGKETIKFGCQSFTRRELEIINRIVSSSDINAKLSVHGIEITKQLVDKLLNMLK